MAPYPRAMADYPVLRQSLLSDFDACGLTSKFAQEYGRLWSGAPQARGHILHRTFAKCLETMAEHNEDTIEVDVALAILNENLRQHDVPVEDVVCIPLHQVADLYWVTKKWAYDTRWSIKNLIAVEERLSTTLRYPDPEGGFVEREFSGQPDALFAEGLNMEQGIVIDWKDTWGMPGPSDISEQGFFQQRSYALLVMRRYSSLTSVTLREFYPRYSQAREATIYRHELENIEAELTALAERFDRCHEADVWPASPGKHCGYCTRPTACPIFPTARREGMIADGEQAANVAAQVVVAEAVLKQNKGALKAWAATHGPIPIRDAKQNRVYGHRASTRIERPSREEMEKHMAAGEALNLDELYTEKVSTRFDAHVPKPTIEPDDAETVSDLEAALQLSLDRVGHE